MQASMYRTRFKMKMKTEKMGRTVEHDIRTGILSDHPASVFSDREEKKPGDGSAGVGKCSPTLIVNHPPAGQARNR